MMTSKQRVLASNQVNAVDLNFVKGLIDEALDSKRLHCGRERQKCVGRGQSPDYAPLILGHRVVQLAKDDHFLAGGTPVPEIKDYPHFNLTEQISSPKVMLYEALWDIVSWARTPSDAQLSVRPNLVFILPTCFGMGYQVSDEGTAWFPNPISLDEALDTDLNDLKNLGDVPLVLEHLHFFRENISKEVNISCPIAVGTLNQADYILGTRMWTEFCDHPQKMSVLMDKINNAIIKLLKLYKEAVGEPMESSYIGPLYLSHGGIKIGNDSLVMLSPEMFREFVQPFTTKLCKAFSGGYHHSCGFYPKHLHVICETTGLTTINFGEPQLWDMPEAVSQIHESGKFYYGGWVRLPDEPIEVYLRRGVELCGPHRNRAILYAMGEGAWPKPAETMDMWYRLQDERYPR